MWNRYKCHKEVNAFQVTSLAELPNGAMLLRGDEYGCVAVMSAERVELMKPEVGGYYVVYDDGYSSFSPQKSFERGYTVIQ